MKKVFSFIIILVMMLAMLPTAQANEYMNVYAPDGRVEVIKTADFYAWHAVGWYSAPVMYVYALDGRTNLILESDFDAWHKVGWYSKPVMTVYAGNKSTVIAKEDFKNWKNVGWDAYIKLNSMHGHEISVLSQKLDENYYYCSYYHNGCEYVSQQGDLNAPLGKIEECTNGANISLEKAKEIALNYCRNMGPYYYNYIAPKLMNYSDTTYLIGVTTDGKYSTGFDLIAVNKTTGYAFHCGSGSTPSAKLEALYAM